MQSHILIGHKLEIRLGCPIMQLAWKWCSVIRNGMDLLREWPGLHLPAARHVPNIVKSGALQLAQYDKGFH